MLSLVNITRDGDYSFVSLTQWGNLILAYAGINSTNICWKPAKNLKLKPLTKRLMKKQLEKK